MIGHVAPEAYVGGPIAGIESGDTIVIDIAERTLEVDLSRSELESRLDTWEQPEDNYTSGVLAKYGGSFGSASYGAVTNPALE